MAAVAIFSTGDSVEFDLHSNPIVDSRVQDVQKVILSGGELHRGQALLGRTQTPAIGAFVFWGDNAREIVENWDSIRSPSSHMTLPGSFFSANHPVN